MGKSRTILTVGTFDILHGEHIDLFDACRDLAGKKGKVHVGVNDDAFVEGYKGKAPMVPQRHRYQVIKNLRQVDEVWYNTEPSLHHLLNVTAANYLVVGSDWMHPKDYMTQIGVSWEQMWDMSCRLVFVPSLGNIHSSELKGELRGRD